MVSSSSSHSQRAIVLRRDALRDLARTPELTGADSRVLLAIFGLVGRVDITQTALAEYLGLHEQQVGRSLQRLRGLGWILAEETSDASDSYWLNPANGWKVDSE